MYSNCAKNSFAVSLFLTFRLYLIDCVDDDAFPFVFLAAMKQVAGKIVPQAR